MRGRGCGQVLDIVAEETLGFVNVLCFKGDIDTLGFALGTRARKSRRDVLAGFTSLRVVSENLGCEPPSSERVNWAFGWEG